MLPRSVRNNNPGNLNAGQPWQGLMPRASMDAMQAAEPRFAVFQTPAWGFRALIRVLAAYHNIHGMNTVRGMISRWAPPSENDTGAYIDAVAGACGVSPDAKVAYPTLLKSMAKAITVHETGSWEPYWHDPDLDSGYQLAGF